MDDARAVAVVAPNGRSLNGTARFREDGATLVVEEPLAVSVHDTLRMTWEQASGLLRAFASVRSVVGTRIELGPPVLERVDRRRARRYPVDFAAHLAWHDRGRPECVEARANDLAVLGGSFLTPAVDVPSSGEQVAVRVVDAEGRTLVATPATVVAVDDRGDERRLGVEWRLDPRQEQLLLEYVRQGVAASTKAARPVRVEVGAATCWIVTSNGLRGPLQATIRPTGVTLEGIATSEVTARDQLVALMVGDDGRRSTVPMRVVSLAGGRVHVIIE